MILKTTIALISIILSASSFGHDLTVKITNIKQRSGSIKLAVFPPNAGFPRQYENTIATAIIDLKDLNDLNATYTFEGLPEDNYAIAVFHDVNNNDTLDTNRLNIPTEPFGFSNNPRLFGPPTFRRCNFRLSRNLIINIKLKKLF